MYPQGCGGSSPFFGTRSDVRHNSFYGASKSKPTKKAKFALGLQRSFKLIRALPAKTEGHGQEADVFAMGCKHAVIAGLAEDFHATVPDSKIESSPRIKS
jgi:hypothetical protein